MTGSGPAASIQGSVPTSEGGIVSLEDALEMLGAEGQRPRGAERQGEGPGSPSRTPSPAPSPPGSPAPPPSSTQRTAAPGVRLHDPDGCTLERSVYRPTVSHKSPALDGPGPTPAVGRPAPSPGRELRNLHPRPGNCCFSVLQCFWLPRVLRSSDKLPWPQTLTHLPGTPRCC